MRPMTGTTPESGFWRQVLPSFHMREPSTSQSSIIDSWLPRTVAVDRDLIQSRASALRVP